MTMRRVARFTDEHGKSGGLATASGLRLGSLSTILVVGFLCGCSHSMGESSITDNAMVSDVRPGVSAKADVVKILGPPGDTRYFPSGEERWSYSYAQQHIDSETLGVDSVDSIGLTILFGNDGLVRDITEDKYRHTPQDMQHLKSSSRSVTSPEGAIH